MVCPAQEKTQDKSQYLPQIHGILRGKFEYEPDLSASRFEVRNARLSAEGNLPLHSSYKLEVDLCDESEIKMKDAWVRVTPWRTLRISIGQQRMPFSIDAHRNPSAQYFANRSFIAKQVGDMRDVGIMAGYTWDKLLIMDAGLFNGSNISDQKTAWHSDWNYSARVQYLATKGLTLMASVQHTAIADHEAHYTSFDIGGFYEIKGWHAEAEWLHKSYSKDAFDDCNAVDVMLLYKQGLRKCKFLESISYQGRYDYMGDHSDGKNGFEEDGTLTISDYERHRLTMGVTFAVRNPYFPTLIRFNYEKYWYPDGGAKTSEQDKFVAELAIRF